MTRWQGGSGVGIRAFQTYITVGHGNNKKIKKKKKIMFE